MKRYIKLYELFSIKAKYPYEKLDSTEEDEIIYTFNTGNYIYDVIFTKHKDGWEAEHKIGNPFTYARLKLTNDNVYGITSTVIHITKEFITDYNPNYLLILYIGTPDEDSKDYDESKIKKINKRARLQSNYLKQIEGYTAKYYYRINNHSSSKTRGNIETLCVFYKNGYDLTNAEIFIKEYQFVSV